VNTSSAVLVGAMLRQRPGVGHHVRQQPGRILFRQHRLGVAPVSLCGNIAICYIGFVKPILYSAAALKSLKRHGNVAVRLKRAIEEYAADPAAHANNVTRLVGSISSRMRVGDYRVVFVETDTEIEVVKIGPRGDVYD
jgi:mRNA interferase RelE/StbE